MIGTSRAVGRGRRAQAARHAPPGGRSTLPRSGSCPSRVPNGVAFTPRRRRRGAGDQEFGVAIAEDVGQFRRGRVRIDARVMVLKRTKPSRPSITDAAKITRLIRMRTSMTNGLLIADRTASYNQPLAGGSGLRMPTGCRLLLGRDGSTHPPETRSRRYEELTWVQQAPAIRRCALRPITLK